MGSAYTVAKQTESRFPDHVEDYQIIRELGRGRFGVVHEVKVKDGAGKRVKVTEEVEGQARYALKRVPLSRVEGDVQAELANHRALPPHPHVTALFEHFRQEQEICFILELCDGGTLNDYVIRHHPGLEVKRSLMMDMASGLAHLHQHRLVHRDLKPNNILLSLPPASSPAPRAKISDLGIARLFTPGLHRKTSHQDLAPSYLTTSCGSLPFEAPEVISHHYTEKCDVFSLGLVFYVMLVEAVSADSSGRLLLIPQIKAKPLNLFCYASQPNIRRRLEGTVSCLGMRILLEAMLKRCYRERMSAPQVLDYLRDYIAKA